MEMSVVALAGDVQRMVFNGSLDRVGTTEIDVEFSEMAGANRNILVDLEKVAFLSSIGIRALVLNAKVVQRRGGKMVLLNPQPMVENILRTSGTNEVIPVFTDVDEALAQFAAT